MGDLFQQSGCSGAEGRVGCSWGVIRLAGWLASRVRCTGGLCEDGDVVLGGEAHVSKS